MAQDFTEEYGRGSRGEDISSYIIPAILSLLCCWPLAIPAIICAIQVSSKITHGDIDGARRSSGMAKTWSFIAIGLGLVLYLISIIAVIFVIAANANNPGLR